MGSLSIVSPTMTGKHSTHTKLEATRSSTFHDHSIPTSNYIIDHVTLTSYLINEGLYKGLGMTLLTLYIMQTNCKFK